MKKPFGFLQAYYVQEEVKEEFGLDADPETRAKQVLLNLKILKGER